MMFANQVIPALLGRWTPAALSPSAWFSSVFNPSAIVTDGQNRVLAWNDLSGNNNHATPIGLSNAPYYRTGPNRIESDNADQLGFLELPVELFTGSSMIVTNYSATQSSDGSRPGEPVLGCKLAMYDATIFAGGNTVVGTTRDAHNDVQTRLDGVPSGQLNTIAKYAAPRILVAKRYWLGLNWNWSAIGHGHDQKGINSPRIKRGAYYEIVVFQFVLNDSQAELLEGYAAHLHGLEGLLPSGHPYKSSPPLL